MAGVSWERRGIATQLEDTKCFKGAERLDVGEGGSFLLRHSFRVKHHYLEVLNIIYTNTGLNLN